MKKIIPVLLIGILLIYQNCQKKDSSTYDVVGTTTNSSEEETPTPTPEEIVKIRIESSKYSDFHELVSSAGFNYTDTIYQRVKNLGPNGKACQRIGTNFPTNCTSFSHFSSLSTNPDWSYDASSDTWSSSFPAKNYHGMTVYHQFARSGASIEGPYENATSRIFSVKSVAATSTSDIVVFASVELAGLSVMNSIPQNHAFFTHVKNGNTSQKVCQYVTKTDSGQNNPTNPCTMANINNPEIWLSLPDDEVADNNTSMTTYHEPANTYHKTGIGNYIYSGGQIHGPFWITIVDPT